MVWPQKQLSKLDIFKPLPENLKGKYDVVHLRYFMTIAKEYNVQVVLENLRHMLSKSLLLPRIVCYGMYDVSQAAVLRFLPLQRSPLFAGYFMA